MVANLDSSLWFAGLEMRSIEFGQVLRWSRSSSTSNPVAEQLGLEMPPGFQGWELSFDPAVQRTLAALQSLQVMNEPVPPAAQAWANWVGEALRAVQRIAARCWYGVSSDIRRAFLDQDDAPPLATNSYVFGLRHDQPGLGAGRFAELNQDNVKAALGAAYSEIRESQTAIDARTAASQIESRPTSLVEMLQIRQLVMQNVQRTVPEETVEQGSIRIRSELRDAYTLKPELEEAVGVLRNHNSFVHKCIWALLGLAESIEPISITSTIGALSEQSFGGERRVKLTVKHPAAAFLRSTHPVWIDLGSPVDGLYWVEQHTFAWAGGEEDDLTLVAYSP